MTEFERIKAMSDVDLAIYISRLQNRAIEDFQNGIFPKGYFENLRMLRSESMTDKGLK